MGRGGISAEDLPPSRTRGRHGAPAGPDGSCRPGCCWATRRWPARDWRWARRRCGCMRRCPARWAWPPGRWPCPCRRGLGDAAPALRHAHPARKTACSRSRTRRRCSARSNGARQVGAPALGLPEQRMQCQHPAASTVWGGTRNVLWLGCRCWSCCRPTPAAPSWRMNARTSPAGTDAMPAGCISRGCNGRKRAATGASQGLGQRAAAALHELARATLPGSQPGFRARMRVPGRRGIRAGLRRGVRVGCPDGDLSAGRALHEYASSLHADAAARNRPGPWSGWRRMACWPARVTRPRRRSGCIRPVPSDQP